MDLDELPPGWRAARIREICEHPQYGHTASAQNAEVGPKMLRITDIQDGCVDWSSVPFCRCDEVEKYRLKVGDILFARTDATTGKSFLVREVQDAVFASYLIRLRVRSGVLPEYLFYYFQSSEYWAAVGGGIDDGNRPNMNGSKLAELVVPFPENEEEQRRIVARVEALTCRLDQARQARQAAIAEANVILAAAVSSLLEKRKAEPVPLHTLLATQPRNGWSPPAEFQTGHGIPVLTLSAVTGFAYDGSRVKFSSAPTKNDAHYWLERDELLITRSNTPELVGHAAIYDGTPPRAICCDLIMKMKTDPLKADVRFVHYCLRSPAVRQFIIRRAKGTSGTMLKIAKPDVQEIPIPNIAITEQRTIVAQVDALRGKLDELQRLQREVEADLTSFTPALLAKAFRGEL